MYYGIAQHEYGPRPTHFWPSARGLGPMLGLRHLLAGSRSDGARPSPSSRGTSRKLTERRATLQVTGTAQHHWADHAALPPIQSQSLNRATHSNYSALVQELGAAVGCAARLRRLASLGVQLPAASAPVSQRSALRSRLQLSDPLRQSCSRSTCRSGCARRQAS